ncbi:MAG TPA: dephospho-CoA kinase [Cytophagales bacterium]|nr:dephospho-CoA kinase [Cytophagales bacterium]HAP64639.1 dephospho-CoA kinase [Cytophagales bacterium]
MNKPQQIGVTGGIGSGKSTVCQIFGTLGVPTYEADSRAKWLMSHDEDLIRAIKDQFGEESYADGELNRPFLSKTVFYDPEKVAFMNQLVHPRVGEDYKAWVQTHTEQPYVIREAAIMLEKGYHEYLDAVVNVAAPVEVRMTRVLLRDLHRDREQVEAIMEKQLSEEIRREQATHTVDNDGKRLLIPQVTRLHGIFAKGKTAG